MKRFKYSALEHITILSYFLFNFFFISDFYPIFVTGLSLLYNERQKTVTQRQKIQRYENK